MKKTVIATALLAVVGVASAFDSVGETTKSFLNVGGSTFADTHFHGPNGAPGVGFADYVISLSSISFSALQVGSESGFNRYQLLGYTHPGVDGIENYNFNWAQVPTGNQEVYFGLVTNTDSSDTAAFYVGDRTGWAIPTSNTSYTTVALVETTGNGSSPAVLQGTLNLVNGNLNTAGAGLTDGTNTLVINTAVNAGAGTFSGTSAYNSDSGTASGAFFGSGSSSAVAGVADGGSAYQAAFGGIAQ
ncbi:hypothetical protein D8I35_16380 [Corticibacter populi]|uniref:Transferrin-binding protein B C-lobe/N-lobe beta barrel domain-containing protein n=1 Tax=Corticibacter populi TaxID=1550736 RepID=A0A3M6QLS4_9BURK|nr:hypothetical protein [Corticibacter populi]RMX03459.1 hypothetical protein D8I35_16380 [Corticibacter populi]RZS29897.1 hypothetical protein EV687_3381 [Corticibacter populi]